MWLLQWPIRAIVLLIVAWLPLGVEVSSFPIAMLSAVVIGLLGTLLIWPLKLLLGPVLGGVVYAVLSAVILRILGLDVDFTRAAALITTAPVV